MTPNAPSPSDVRSTRALLAAGAAACDEWLARHLDAVQRRFGDAGPGVIDLPELGPEPLIAEQIGVAAVLFWCRELEAAGFLPFVEALARGVADGSLALPIGASVHRLLPFWRERETRFTERERLALYQQVFGGQGDGVMQGFAVWFDLFVGVLIEIGRADRDRGVGDLQARLAVVATDIGHALSSRAVGIAGFAAREIVSHVREALEVLREPEIVHALGGGEPASLIARWSQRLLQRSPDVASALSCADAGVTLLRWIAEHARSLEAASARVDRGHPLTAAAERFRAARRGLA